MVKKKVETSKARDDDAQTAQGAVPQEILLEDADAEDGGEPIESETEGEPEVYRTQKEIDAAMGRRLRRERERWEKKHARALMLEEALGEGGVEEAIAAILSQRMGIPPEDVLSSIGQAQDPRELADAARRAALMRDTEQLRQQDPAFDLDAAMQDPAFRALVEAGEPLTKAYGYANMDRSIEQAREEARLDMMRSIRARGGRPAALRAQGGYAGADFSNMPEAALRAIDERLKRGEKIKLK